MNNFIPKLGLSRKAIEPSLAKFRRPPAETPKCEEETSQADKSLLLISKLPLLRREHLECDIFRAFRALDQSQCEPLLHNMPISKMRWVRGGKRGPHMNGYPQIPPPTPTHSTICIFPLQWVGGHCVSGRGWEWIRGTGGKHMNEISKAIRFICTITRQLKTSYLKFRLAAKVRPSLI